MKAVLKSLDAVSRQWSRKVHRNSLGELVRTLFECIAGLRFEEDAVFACRHLEVWIARFSEVSGRTRGYFSRLKIFSTRSAQLLSILELANA